MVGLKLAYQCQTRLHVWRNDVLWQFCPFWIIVDVSSLHRVRSNRSWNSPFVTKGARTCHSESSWFLFLMFYGFQAPNTKIRLRMCLCISFLHTLNIIYVIQLQFSTILMKIKISISIKSWYIIVHSVQWYGIPTWQTMWIPRVAWWVGPQEVTAELQRHDYQTRAVSSPTSDLIRLGLFPARRLI